MDSTRSPSEFFIKYLISREYSVETILSILDDHQLIGATGRYIAKLKKVMDDERPSTWAPASGNSEAHKTTVAYLRKHKIYGLWYPNEPAQEAYRILGDPKIREGVEQLLLSTLKLEEIVKRINSHHNAKLTSDGLATFSHYFWNKNLLSMAEWVSLMEERPASYQKIATLRSAPDVADMIVPWLAGISGPPPNINTGSVARRMRDVAFLKVLEIERHPATYDHARMMKTYMDIITSAENEMRQSDVALKEVLAAFEKFRMKKDTGSTPSIEQVAGLNHSKAVQESDDFLESDKLLEE